MKNKTLAQGLLLLTLLVAFWLRVHNLTNLPPGLHYDEAANGILAGDIALRGYRPIFISSYTGKEVLYFYAAAGIMRGVGESVFSLRLASAFLGLLTVAGVVRFGRILAPRKYSLGLFAAILLATSFTHVLFSRLGFRAIAQPLLQLLSVLGLLIGVRFGRKRDFILGGIFLGLTAYTYLAARLFPVLLTVLVLGLLIPQRRGERREKAQVLSGLGVYFGVATLVLVPLLTYFWQNPDAFWVRIGQVASEGAAPTAADYWASYVRTLGMFVVKGDPYWRFNLPDLPLLGWVLGGLWLIGCGLWLLTKKSGRHTLPFIIATPFLMILPSALALGEIVPSNLRAIGVYPFLLLPIAFVFAWVGGRWPVVTVLLGMGLLFGRTALTSNQYFTQWGGLTDNFYESDSDLIAIADYLNDLPATNTNDEALYVAALHYRHPTVAFASDRYDDVKWLPLSEALVIPQGKGRLIYPHNSPAPAWAQAILPEVSAEPLGPDNKPLYSVYELDNLTPPAPQTPTAFNFGAIQLTGYDIVQATGDGLTMRLYWQINAPSDQNFMPFVHVEDATGQRWGQRETFAYPSEQWAAGETVIQQVDVPLAAGLPPSHYRVLVGLFSGDQRLPLLDDAGRYAGSAAILDGIKFVAGQQQPAPTVPNLLNIEVAEGLTLLGFARGGDSAETNTQYPLTLYWHATQTPPELTTHIRFVGDDGRASAWQKSQPSRGAYPFIAWQSPSYVTDILDVVVPLELAAGRYQIELNMMEFGVSAYATILGEIEVTVTEREFVRDAIDHIGEPVFGDDIRLIDASLVESAENEFTLELVWNAITTPAQDYTVFVHVLNLDGTCCIWQQDVMPRQNSYPTTRWLPDELIRDTYTIPLDPAGNEYAIEIGLYVAETGQRLTVQSNNPDNKDSFSLEEAIRDTISP